MEQIHNNKDTAAQKECKKQHKHDHGSAHSHSHNANKKVLKISFILIAGFMFVEFIGGFLTNSLALLSDAGHMLSDSVALGLSLAAFIFGEKVATSSKTFGYKRFEILAALLNGLVLIFISVYIFKEAIDRLSEPHIVMGQGMMIISVIGLIINIIVAYIMFTKGETKENLNLRSAFMHVIGDLLGSVGAIIAAVLIIAFGWYIADSIASMIVSILVLYSGWRILKESINVLMEAKPGDIDLEDVRADLLSINGVKDVHDLHIWMITSDYLSMTVHLSVGQDIDRDTTLRQIQKLIQTNYGITHLTVQMEGDSCNCIEACDWIHK